jgi:hypothetical protein
VPSVRRLASVLLPLLVVVAALAVASHVARTGVPVQGGPIFGGPGGWRVDRNAPPTTAAIPFMPSQ